MTKVIFRPLIEERGFDKFFNEISNNVEIPFKRFLRIDVVDAEKSIEFIAELPGVKKEDVKILLEDGVLTVSGEKKNEFKGNEKINIFRNERLFGRFERKFELPEDINLDEITAKFENGLLKISIAKLVTEKPKERIIEVK
ncbi:MAG: Hsp20/alpha crystallin family protein [Bacteroidetes bacterium]|nr:Hsp20/alpha crystallin family protein [Bacteroidota bacterium]MCH8035185.1 Hsp20/alpha crystallin family protein [Bacteroidota bacterium]